MNFRFHITLFFSLFISLQLSAQVANSLLWKATSKGKKTVYLYGTIHIRDNSVFNLSDSTVNAMKNSAIVAAEVDLEEAVYEILSNLFTSDTNNLLSKQMPESDFKKIKENIEESSGLDISNIKADKAWMIDLLKKNAEWEVDESKANETVLDAFILQVGRSMGKPIIGIEKLDDYNVISKKFEEKFKENLMARPIQQEFNPTIKDVILGLYKAEKIQDLYDAIYPELNSYDKEWLDERNRIMTYRLDSIANQKGIFFAVGAAHLAGKYGLIQLLEAKGYTLTPVKCATSTAIKKINISKPVYNWSTIKSDTSGYSFESPKKLVAFPVNVKNMNIQMQVAPDIYSGKYFMVMEIKTPYLITSQNAPAILKRMDESYKNGRGTEKISSEVLEGPELPYLRLLMKKKSAFFNMYIYLLSDRMVFLTVHGNKKSIQAEESKRFLSSFKYINFDKMKNAESNNELKYFEDTITASKLLMPANSRFNSQVIPAADENSNEVVYYQREGTLEGGTETVTHIVFDMKSEFDGEMRTNVIKNVIDNLTRKEFQLKEAKDTVLAGFVESKILKMINRRNNNSNVYMILCMRDNRMHQIFTESANSNPKHFSEILKSLKFEPYTVVPKKDYITKDSIKMKYEGIPDSSFHFDFTFSGNHPVHFYDKNSGLITKISTFKTSPYLTVDDKQKYLDSKLKSIFRSEIDTLYSEALQAGKTGFRKTYYLKNEDDSIYVRKVMLYQAPNMLFALTTNISKRDAKCGYLNYFYDNFQTLYSTYTAKTFDDLISDLKSKDTTVSKAAYDGITGLSISEKSFPKLSKALYDSYEIDKRNVKEFNRPVAQNLLGVLIDDKSKTHFDFVEKLYVEDKSTALRRHILSELRGADSVQLDFFSSLISKSLELNTDSTLLANFDNTFFFKNRDAVFNALTKNIDKADYQTLWILAFRKQLYSSQISNTGDNKEKVLKLLEGPYKENLTKKDFLYKKEIIDILSEYNDDRATKLIEAMKYDEDLSIRLSVVIAQIERNITPDAEILKSICVDPLNRFTLYTTLDKKKKSNLFPESYKTESLLAEGAFCYYLTYEYEDYGDEIKITDTKILAVKKSSNKKQKGNIYLIKFKNKVDNKWYAGVTGYYKPKVDPNANYSTYWPEEEYQDSENTAELLNRYELELKNENY